MSFFFKNNKLIALEKKINETLTKTCIYSDCYEVDNKNIKTISFD